MKGLFRLIWGERTMLLEAAGITAGYGRGNVLENVDLTVETGEIVCIIGPNGAGKSTVLRTIAGQIFPSAGVVQYRGREVTRLSIAEKGNRGLIFIPQGMNIFPNLSVYENLEMAGMILKDRRALHKGVQRVLSRFPVLAELANRPCRELSGGQRQLLAISRILITSPRLVLLDEPSLGLAPMVVDQIFEEIRQMNEAGVSFLLVEQNARKALSVSHRGYVLELGKNRLTGPGRDLLKNPEVKKLYLGG